jgi:hypothetical protein
MDKNFCQQIDQESLVEKYVAGKLRGELLKKFEDHIQKCEEHAQSVLLEKALKRGVSEFARGEIKSRLRDRLKKREDTRFMMLRYAAILLIAVITPLILYYQFNVAPDEMAKSVADADKSLSEEESEVRRKSESETPVVPASEKQKSPETAPEIAEEEPKKPAPPASAERSVIKPENDMQHPQESEEDLSETESLKEEAQLQDLLKAAESSQTSKLEADYPSAPQSGVTKSARGVSVSQTTSVIGSSNRLSNEGQEMVVRDSLKIRECFNNHLNDTEREKYSVDLKIQVLESGKTGEIKVIQASSKSKELEICIFQIINSWTFSKKDQDSYVTLKITYPR